MYLGKTHKFLLAVGAVVALGAGVLWVGSGDRGTHEAVVSAEAPVRRMRPAAHNPQVKPHIPKPAPPVTMPRERRAVPIRQPAPEPVRGTRATPDTHKVVRPPPKPGC